MSSLQKYLFKSLAHFIICILVFFSIELRSSLQILEMNHLSDIWFVHIISHSMHVLSLCWLFPWVCIRFSVWCSPTCLFLFLLPVFLMSYSWKHCTNQCQEAFPVCFFFFPLGVLHFQVLHLSLYFMLSWFLYGGRWVQFHSFACGNSIFPTLFVKETIFSPLCILGAFVEDQLTISVDHVCADFQVLYPLPLIYRFVFMSLYCFDYNSFIIYFKNQKLRWL